MLAVMLRPPNFAWDKANRSLLLGSNALLNLLLKRDLGASVNAKTYAQVAASYGIKSPYSRREATNRRQKMIGFSMRLPNGLKKGHTSPATRTLRPWLFATEAQDVPNHFGGMRWKLYRLLRKVHFFTVLFFDSKSGCFSAR